MNQTFSGTFYTQNQHSPTEAAVILALDKYGSIQKEQLKYLVPPYVSDRADYIGSICKHLSVKKKAKFVDGEYLVSNEAGFPDENVVLSLWVLIDMLKDRNISEIIKCCPVPKYPCTVSYIEGLDTLFSIIPIATESDFSKIMLENTNYAGYHDSGLKREYIVVIRDMSLIEGFNKIRPDFPFRIAHAKGDLTSEMEIEYYTTE